MRQSALASGGSGCAHKGAAREEGKLGSDLHHAMRTASSRAHSAGFDRGGARRTVLGAHLVEDTVPTEAAADRVLGLDLVRLPAVTAKVGRAAAWAHEQVERGVMIHGVVGEGALILKQFATVDEPLLVGGHSQAALLDQVLQLRDRRRRLDGELKSNTCARDLPRGALRRLERGQRGGGAASRGALPSRFLTVTSISARPPSRRGSFPERRLPKARLHTPLFTDKGRQKKVDKIKRAGARAHLTSI